MNTNCCDKNGLILDAECRYANGKFYMGRLPSCLPRLFTLRFTASADYAAGDVIVVDEREYPVLTSQMEPANPSCFKTGAVVMCAIDRDRKYAFIHTGGVDGKDGKDGQDGKDGADGKDARFQTGDLIYYIDPNGDDSPANPGGQASPFKTLSGAGRAAWENIVMNPLGKLVFSFNPGSYDLSPADSTIMLLATHPLPIVFQGTESGDKPLITADHFSAGHGKREFRDLRLHATSAANQHPMGAYENGTVNLVNSEILLSKSDTFVIAPLAGGTLRILGTLKVNGNGYTPHSVLLCRSSALWAHDAQITLENIPSVATATAWNEAGHMFFQRTTISGSITGKRYLVTGNGVINTLGGGANFIPGTAAGTTSNGGYYC